MKFEAIAVCLFGVESTVSYELKNLGFTVTNVSDGRVTFETDAKGIATANISLRCAERILVKLGEFQARTFDELFENVKKLPLEKYIPVDANFPVAKAKSINSKLFSVSDIQAITKKAAVERLKSVYKTEWFCETGEKHPIHVFINKDIVQVTIDTTGPALHKRGYRQLSGGAPIRETIAAFMVMLTPWNESKLLVDPMCGSGTIAIEAAMIGANIMPGINRNFQGEELSFISKSDWMIARKEAIEKENHKEFKIYAYDIDPEMVKLAKSNAQIAGVDHLIDFMKSDATKFHSSNEYGFIITNPPYGERMGEKEEVYELYKQLGKAFKHLPTWSIYVISSLENVEELFGKKAMKKRKLYNGMLKSHYYQFPGPKPPKVQN
nr:class I SAM-dependent RNA methyltransferase [Proteocatella sphenisci]